MPTPAPPNAFRPPISPAQLARDHRYSIYCQSEAGRLDLFLDILKLEHTIRAGVGYGIGKRKEPDAEKK